MAGNSNTCLTAPWATPTMQTMRHFAAMFPIIALTASVATAQMGPAFVDVAPVEKRAIEITQPLVATVEPVTRSVLAAEVAGLVAERNFEEGQLISPQTVLVKMRAELLTAQHAAAVAAEASARASIERAKAQSANASNREQRVRKSFEAGSSGVDEMTDAETAAKVAAAEVKVAESTLNEKTAEVARLQLLLDKSQIHSPIPGVVVKRHVEVGQWVEQGKPVAEILWLDPLWVRVHVPENVVSRVHEGDKAVVTVDALAGRKFVAKVDQIVPEADPGSRTFPIKLKLENKNGEVRPGMFARATLLASSEGPSLVVPKDAMVHRGPSAHVVAVREGKTVVVPVTRGTAQGQYVAVTPIGDLSEKDMVVVRGNESLRGGEMAMVRQTLPAFVPATQSTTAPSTMPSTAPAVSPTTGPVAERN